ncbi:MAG: electron transfer flavoprotein subunit beta/FixA family protein [Oscillospiraceae bacterium]|nr:electron transfer flavoprotein subunit beta/FixA family protein [Oscillospiraceae bacterium]
MNILVCIKQVPDPTELKADPAKNTLNTDEVPKIINPFDSYALEAAARIKDKDPETKIVIVTIGTAGVEKALKEGLGIAADQAYFVSDEAFADSDSLATAYILSCAVKKIEETEGKFNAIFCGKQATDGDSAQVGPQLAEYLGYPLVTYGLEAFDEGDTLKINKEIDGGIEVIAAQTPCVVTFTKPSWDPRYPTIKRKMAANRAQIPTLTGADFAGLDASAIGAAGSPTKVIKTFVPQRSKSGIKIQEESDEESAKKLFALLSDARVI